MRSLSSVRFFIKDFVEQTSFFTIISFSEKFPAFLLSAYSADFGGFTINAPLTDACLSHRLQRERQARNRYTLYLMVLITMVSERRTSIRAIKIRNMDETVSTALVLKYLQAISTSPHMLITIIRTVGMSATR